MTAHIILEMSDDGRLATLKAPYTYENDEISVTVPEGFETDFNSVPRGLWNFFPPWQFPEAAVVHDYLYRNPGLADRGLADRTHRKLMIENGASRWKAYLAWSMLRSFGWSAYKG